MKSFKYKDCDPKITIKRIQKILDDNNINVEESCWQNTQDPLIPKSLSVRIKNLHFSVNGKGLNEDFARASAYGELMERSQNIMMLRNFFNLSNTQDFYLKTSDRLPFNNNFKLFEKFKGVKKEELNFIRNSIKEKKYSFDHLGMIKS